MPIRTTMLVLLLSFGSAAFADCTYGGKSYPEGTRIGPYTCAGGQWVTK